MPGRPTDWMDTLVNETVGSGTQGVVPLSTALVAADSARATVIRTIVRLYTMSTSVAGAWGTQVVDMAIGIASQEAFTASVLPDPNVDTDKPARGWLWRTRVVQFQNGVGTMIATELVADIRGARKIENGELYLIIVNSAGLGTSFSTRTTGLVRTLIKI